MTNSTGGNGGAGGVCTFRFWQVLSVYHTQSAYEIRPEIHGVYTLPPPITIF